MKKINSLLSICIAIFIFFWGCGGSQEVEVEFPPIKFENYKTFKSLRTGYAPGYIFRINDNDEEFFIKQVNLDNSELYIERQTFPSSQKKWKTDILLSFMGLSFLTASANYDDFSNILIDLGNCNREALPDSTILKSIRNAKLNFKKDSKYYMIYETISVDSIRYTQLDSLNYGLIAKAEVDSLNKGDAKFTREVTGSKTLIQKFEKPYRVLYKICEFNEKGPLLHGEKDYNIEKVYNVQIKE